MYWGHRLASVLGLLGLWFHILWESDDKKRNVIRLSSITGALFSNWLVRLVVVVLNYRRYQRCIIRFSDGVSKIQIPLAPGSRFVLSPGQYIYLMIPMISLEMHRFYICWADEHRIWLLVQPYDSESFTGKLVTMSDRTSVLVEGIYGPMSNNLGSFGTVMFVTVGIKIAPILPCIKWLREEHKHRRIVTQRITLIWTIEIFSHLNWVRSWVNDLIAEDGQLVSNVYQI